MSISFASATEPAERIASGELTSREVVKVHLERIKAHNDTIKLGFGPFTKWISRGIRSTPEEYEGALRAGAGPSTAAS